MKQDTRKKPFFICRGDVLEPTASSVVTEYPLQLIVNGREIATLIGSPHDLRFLVAGFLRLQGFVSSLQDFEIFSVCEEFGTANIRIKGELPERLKPVLTSGCGTGITFTLPDVSKADVTRPLHPERRSPRHIFTLMNELTKKADQYRSHGGIHSAAIGRNGALILYAEDLGRHNTFDRIAGEALFKGIDMSGAELVTSGRVSTEMVAKASLMGISVIASRTSPTDMAIKLCDQAGICLVGYVRGGSFTVYSHPEVIEEYPEREKIAGVTGVILAGGASRRMGSNKALLEVDGNSIISRIYRTLAGMFHEVIVVTNSPLDYEFLPCRKVPDIYSNFGSIAGLHSALTHSRTAHSFVTACDMPFLDQSIIRYLCHLRLEEGCEAVIPYSKGGQEPLHAVYSSACKDVFEQAILEGERKVVDILKRINIREVTYDEVRSIGGQSASFLNVNTPEEYEGIK
ncbi:MAG: formate dehydrogenase accessory sulfurtransferase FdhD [Desulfuromonadaceae bacterium]|nr:formate dehydrogenase accessory sulfurtransferase FdhD [Desulfuromonadaceae bacterium]